MQFMEEEQIILDYPEIINSYEYTEDVHEYTVRFHGDIFCVITKAIDSSGTILQYFYKNGKAPAAKYFTKALRVVIDKKKMLNAIEVPQSIAVENSNKSSIGFASVIPCYQQY